MGHLRRVLRALLVGFAAGGATDITFRKLAELAAKQLGQPIVVENKPGAGATLAPSTMAKTDRPDGYTIAAATAGLLRYPYMQKVDWDPINDFTWIAGLGADLLLLLARIAAAVPGATVDVGAGAVPVLIGLAVIASLWGSYLPAAAALAPLGDFNVMLPLVVIGAVFVLFLTLIVHIVSLFYWNRLKPFTQRGLIIWGAVIGFLLVLAVGFHFVQQDQRENWMAEHLDDWRAQAATDTLRLGANSNVTLGYSFVSAEDESSEVPIEDRLAELDAIIDSGALMLRLGASGDMLFERDEPALFASTTTEGAEGGEASGEEVDVAARIERQQAYEEQFMQRVVESGVDLVIADSQYTPYLLVKGGEEADIAWDDFRAYHRQRVEHYATLYQPYAYEIVNEPAAYSDYSDLADFESSEQQLELWIEHTQDLIDLVREVSPDTLVGVSIAPQTEFDLDYYERVLELDIDFVAFRVYQPAQYDLIEETLAERGRPQEHGAELWLAETWYGYCLAPQRSMDLDAEWLETAVAFAARYEGSVVLPNDFGCFLQPGGTLFATEIDASGRTEVWQTWQRLIEEWAPSEEAARG